MDNEKITIARYRGSKFTKIKKLDLFSKVEENYKEPTPVGGTFSLICFIIIIWLIYSEVNYYLESQFTFKFTPDTDFDEKLKINIDVTVAMPCDLIGADILDTTNQFAYKFGSLDEEETWFELAHNQRIHFENKKHFNNYLRQEYHAVHSLLWKSSFYSSSFGDFPARNSEPDRPHDACRISGSLILNKVAGNFHITAGKSLQLPRGHIHISPFIGDTQYNFSHRIHKFSFGDPSPGIVHPLEGDEMIADSPNTLFNYFIEVVPTKVKTLLHTIDTCQYSVKELRRVIDHEKGSHGMPGIFFKYDFSSLKVTVSQERDNPGLFLAKLCSIIGGIYVCSGIINSIVQFLFNLIMCNWVKSDEKSDYARSEASHSIIKTVPEINL